MTVSEQEIERRVELFARALREHGMRLTHQRLEVVREIAISDTHPDVETLFRGVRRRVPTVSLDTVYRTLGTLVELGLVAQVAATPGPARYDANVARHQHFVCTRCGMVRDVTGHDAVTLRGLPHITTFGTVEMVDVQLRGVCTSCERETAS